MAVFGARPHRQVQIWRAGDSGPRAFRAAAKIALPAARIELRAAHGSGNPDPRGAIQSQMADLASVGKSEVDKKNMTVRKPFDVYDIAVCSPSVRVPAVDLQLLKLGRKTLSTFV